MKRNWNNVLKYFICFVLGLSCFGQMNVYAQEEDSNVDEIGESSYASDVETEDEYDLDEDLNQPVEGANGPIYGYDENAEDEGMTAYAAEDTVRVGDWSYTIYDTGEYVLNGYYGSDSSITLPETLDGHNMNKVTFMINRLPDTVKEVTVPKTYTEICNSAFGYSKIEKINLSQDSNLTRIGNDAFYNTPITEFVMTDNLLEIGRDAFVNTLLKKVTFNDKIQPFQTTTTLISGNDRFSKTTHYNAFGAAPSGLEFVVSDSCQNYKLVDGALLSKDGTILYAQLSNLNGGTYTVPNGVQIIGTYAMSLNNTFNNINIPNSVTTLEDYCLYGTAIQSLRMPDSVVHVQSNICSYCLNLTSVKISDNLEELGEMAGWEAFYSCKNLADVTLGSKLRVIGNASFAGTKITSIHIPDSVEQINFGAFGDIRSLKSVTGCKGLKKIYRLAFRYAGITDFPFGDNLTYVSNSAFYGCNFEPKYPSYLEQAGDGYYVFDGKLAVKADNNYDYAYEVLNLVNQERSKAGLQALTMDKDLLDAAMLRAAEISVLFSHERPTGQDCYTACSKMTGENIAMGQMNPTYVMNSWMNSSGHKANILGSNFKSIGIGCAYINGIYYWVQCFGNNDTNSFAKPQNTKNIVTQFSFIKNYLDSNGVSFAIEPAAPEGNMMADQQKCYGSTKEYALFVEHTDSRIVSIIDNSCISWILAGPGTVKSNDINVTVTAERAADMTLSAVIGNTSNKIVANKTVSFTDHNWTITKEETKATCTKDGLATYTCKDCKKTKKEKVKALGHDYSTDWTIDKAATCTQEGSKSHHCTRCNDKKDVTVIPKLNHNWDSGVETTKATCTKDGVKTYTCKDCKKTKTETIKALGHEYSNDWTIDKKATCQQEGSKSHHCKRCGSKKDVTVVSKTDHNWSSWKTVVKPTTTSEGKEERICKTCNTKQQRPIAKLTETAVETQKMYRLYNPNSGEHFYTANVGEKNHLANIGWIYEGIGWIAPKTSDYPVYRLYNGNGGEHHYTMNKAEKDMLVRAGWKYEGIGWYSADPKDSNSIPLLREYNPNAFANNHNYTTSKPEHNWLISLGWKDEGKAWYALNK